LLSGCILRSAFGGGLLQLRLTLAGLLVGRFLPRLLLRAGPRSRGRGLLGCLLPGCLCLGCASRFSLSRCAPGRFCLGLSLGTGRSLGGCRCGRFGDWVWRKAAGGEAAWDVTHELCLHHAW
jgi:hypothetical protein